MRKRERERERERERARFISLIHLNPQNLGLVNRDRQFEINSRRDSEKFAQRPKEPSAVNALLIRNRVTGLNGGRVQLLRNGLRSRCLLVWRRWSWSIRWSVRESVRAPQRGRRALRGPRKVQPTAAAWRPRGGRTRA